MGGRQVREEEREGVEEERVEKVGVGGDRKWRRNGRALRRRGWERWG